MKASILINRWRKSPIHMVGYGGRVVLLAWGDRWSTAERTAREKKSGADL
jgi:hypothetical protein